MRAGMQGPPISCFAAPRWRRAPALRQEFQPLVPQPLSPIEQTGGERCGVGIQFEQATTDAQSRLGSHQVTDRVDVMVHGSTVAAVRDSIGVLSTDFPTIPRLRWGKRVDNWDIRSISDRHP
jgi:hypothetical protein